jgi:hypothetical protein
MMTVERMLFLAMVAVFILPAMIVIVVDFLREVRQPLDRPQRTLDKHQRKHRRRAASPEGHELKETPATIAHPYMAHPLISEGDWLRTASLMARLNLHFHVSWQPPSPVRHVSRGNGAMGDILCLHVEGRARHMRWREHSCAVAA